MAESEPFWDLYWDVRLQEMETLGKREAILAVSRLIRQMARPSTRLLELGCGEGQIIGTLAAAHGGGSGWVGIDYSPAAIARCRHDYPQLRFLEGDFTDQALLAPLGQFDIVLLVNALHEVFSAGYSAELGEIDVPQAKQKAEEALAGAAGCLGPGGRLVLFDGLEPPGSPTDRLRVRFLNAQAYAHFRTFAREYRPFKITYQETDTRLGVELSRRDFTRYITKSIFLGKGLWKTERFESYQYFNLEEFRAAFDRAGLRIQTLRTLTVNDEKWSRVVEIESPGENFPEEHILIIAESVA